MIPEIQSTANASTSPARPPKKSDQPPGLAGIRERRRSVLQIKWLTKIRPDVREMLRLGWQNHRRWVMP